MAEHAHTTPAPTSAPPAGILHPDRRRLLSGLAGAALAGTAIAMPSDAAAERPDADLLAALAEFDALEREIWPPASGPATIAAEEEWEAVIAPLQARQAEMLDRMCELEAHTLEGFRARARTIVAWKPDYMERLPKDAAAGYVGHRMLLALFRDLAGEGV